MATAELKQPRKSGQKLDAKLAAKLSLDYFNELFPNAATSNVVLEEVEFIENENCWLITLGFDEPTRPKNLAAVQMNKSIADLFGASSLTRKFKIFKVNAKTGKVLSMRIRKFD